jgi:hypothetical protein
MLGELVKNAGRDGYEHSEEHLRLSEYRNALNR